MFSSWWVRRKIISFLCRQYNRYTSQKFEPQIMQSIELWICILKDSIHASNAVIRITAAHQTYRTSENMRNQNKCPKVNENFFDETRNNLHSCLSRSWVKKKCCPYSAIPKPWSIYQFMYLLSLLTIISDIFFRRSVTRSSRCVSPERAETS